MSDLILGSTQESRETVKNITICKFIKTFMAISRYLLLLLRCPRRTLRVTALVRFLCMWPYSQSTGSHNPTSETALVEENYGK